MVQGIIKKLINSFRHKAIVLMYHRIAQPESDVWELAVSAENFEQHLKLLKKLGNVVPLQDLADGVRSGQLPKNSIAITFDDGYIDNFTVAKPLLEKYQLPATFFIPSGQIASKKEFWWDELERILLLSPQLPGVFGLNINGVKIEGELLAEANLTEELRVKHYSWKAGSEAPPTLRAQLYYKVWEQLKPLPIFEQDQCLQTIKNWAGVEATIRPDHRVMTRAELQQLASNSLFTIGAHTVNHPALAFHDASFQKAELNENKKQLIQIINYQVNLLAYPYGSHNGYTIEAAANAHFSAAFTTQEKVITTTSRVYRLGRFQVKNITGIELNNQIETWRSC